MEKFYFNCPIEKLAEAMNNIVNYINPALMYEFYAYITYCGEYR